MPEKRTNKIVYLFGAGATQAELDNSFPALKEKNLGLLISHVSRRGSTGQPRGVPTYSTIRGLFC
jgi:hypothetical protein